MKRIMVSLAVAFAGFTSSFAQAEGDMLYVCSKDNGALCYEISAIDSVRVVQSNVDGIKIDLGLSVCWAAHNIGSSSPEEYGTYFSWYGEDIAQGEWGKGWRMPTVSEAEELMYKCKWEWDSMNGVTGYKVTGPNGNSIFLPATGWGASSPGNISTGIEGNYWLNVEYGACDLQFHDTGRKFIDCGAVGSGFQTVRPVSDYDAECEFGAGSGEYVAYVYQKNGAVDKLDVADIDAISFTEPSDVQIEQPEITEGQIVDLGLSVKWAGWNIGASQPQEYGDYYSWGEVNVKDEYTWGTYIYCNGDENSCYNIGNDIAGTRYDAAAENWGKEWRLPTVYEIEELCNNCTWEWVRFNGVYGHKVTGPNGNSIFLPAAGMRFDSTYSGRGQFGYYWSSTFICAYYSFAYYMSLNEGNLDSGYGNRYYGYPIRPVYVE